MINAIIRWCLKNTFLMVVITIALGAAGYYSIAHSHVDAIPDIGEKQVIVSVDWPGRSPQDMEDQVTYPLVAGLTGTPGVKTTRSMSGFGFSMVFLIFNDNVDYYWARSRVLERINVAQQRLPAGVTPVLGPDATALGQIYWYTLEGEGFDLAELRSIQDWYVRLQLNSVEGVSEVASVGGYVKQYQIDVDPDKLRAYGVNVPEIFEAVKKSNIDVGAKVIEKNGVEFFIRGVGFIKSVEDIEKIALRADRGTPVRVGDVATVTLGPDFRRGALDNAGREAVGGVVVMRYGENAREVVKRVKDKIAKMEPGMLQKKLADGRISKVRIVPFYDRNDIILETMGTLKEALSEELLMAGIVILIFLFHLRTTTAVLVTLPLSVAGCFVLMYLFGVDSNIMSLAGLAIAIGDVGDMGIIMAENIHRHFAMDDKTRSHFQKVYDGATEVAGAIIAAVSNTLISFIPVFFLTDQEGKLFQPLAFTKTFAIGASVLLAITIVPLMCYHLYKPFKRSRRTAWALAAGLGVVTSLVLHTAIGQFTGGSRYSGWPMSIAMGFVTMLIVRRMTAERVISAQENPVSSLIHNAYSPALRWVLAHKAAFMILPVIILAGGAYSFSKLGREFMPPLDEGSFLYMPSLLPQAGLTQAVDVNRKQDMAISTVPEVESVVGKVGRVESALDPAPIGMIETVVILKPESEWRKVPVKRWFSGWPGPLKAPLRLLWPEQRRLTKGEILSELQAKTVIPGVLPSWLQPIETRLVMLQTGFRAMMGVKVYGSDLGEIEKLCVNIADILINVPGAVDIVPDRIVGKPYLQVELDRDRIARYGLTIGDVQETLETAVGGMNIAETVEGRERYPIRIRYQRDLREDLPDIDKVLVAIPAGAQVPLSQLATIETVIGPQEIKGEKGLLVGYVTLNARGRDEVGVVEDAEKALQAALKDGRLSVPAGYHWEWSGKFENQQRAMARMKILLPACLLIMFVMLYVSFKRWWLAFIIYFGVIVSASGGFVMLGWWGANLSVAVWVGFIVLFGVVDDDGVVMSTYLEAVFKDRKFGSVQEIREAVLEAGLKRIRPCLMTTATTVFGLAPIFWTNGRGSDVMKPMAIPAIGGMSVSLITLFIVPCLFSAVEEWKWKQQERKS